MRCLQLMQAQTHSSLQVDTSYRHILAMALPITLAIMIPQLNFITNNIFLGHYTEEALAVAGITGVYYLIFAAIGHGLNNGLGALIARRSGENKPKEVGKLFTQGIYVSLLIAAVGIVLTYTLAPRLLKLAIHDESVYQMALRFLKIRIWGLPFLYIYLLRNALLVGTNQTRYLIWGALAETITNVVLDYALIFGKWGFPSLGFDGAAYASIIAEFMGMFVIFLVIHWKGIGKRFELFQDLRFEKNNATLISRMSAPLIFQHAISIISWQFFYLMIEHHGTTDLAISNTMRNIFGFFGVFTWAFATTTNSMVSNVIGQGRTNEVMPLINRIIRLSVGLSILVFVVLNVAPEPFLRIFGQSEDFVQRAIPVVRVVSLAMVMMSFSVVWLNAVTGTGNSRYTFYIEVVAIVLYCLYVYLTLEVFFLPITIGWLSEWLYWIVLFVLSYWYMRSNRWQGKII